MTVNEAIHCMKSYLPDGRTLCHDCKYYALKDEDGVLTCQSSAAHKLAIKALLAKPKMGKWIKQMTEVDGVFYEHRNMACSICGHSTKYPYSYCPWCGADMRGENDDEERS